MQEDSQLSKPPPQNNSFPADPVDAFMSSEPHLGLLTADIPDSARGSMGGSAGPGGAFPDPILSMEGIQPSNAMSGGLKPQRHFGAGLMMTPVDDDPLYLGPIKPDYIFPLPSSVEDAVQLAWTASYRFVTSVSLFLNIRTGFTPTCMCIQHGVHLPLQLVQVILNFLPDMTSIAGHGWTGRGSRALSGCCPPQTPQTAPCQRPPSSSSTAL